MRINHKQQELIDNFFKTTKEKFPEIEFKDLSTSPDDSEHIWINVIVDWDEERYLEFRDFTSEIESEIDTDYGYRISIMPELPDFAVT